MATSCYVAFLRQGGGLSETSAGGGLSGSATIELQDVEAAGATEEERGDQGPVLYGEAWGAVRAAPGVRLLRSSKPADVVRRVAEAPQVKRMCFLMSVLVWHEDGELFLPTSELGRHLASGRAELDRVFPCAQKVGGRHFHVVVEKKGRGAKKRFAGAVLEDVADAVTSCLEGHLGWRRSQRTRPRQQAAKSAAGCVVTDSGDKTTGAIAVQVDEGTAADDSTSDEVYVALLADVGGFSRAAVVGLTLGGARVPALSAEGCARRIETSAKLLLLRGVGVGTSVTPENDTGTEKGGFGVVASGVDDPQNVGSICRLMACFGAAETLVLLHPDRGNSSQSQSPPVSKLGPESAGFWEVPQIAALVAKTSRGTHSLAWPPCSLSVQDFVDQDQHSDVPLVVIETAADASSIRNFSFPRCCRIVVGNEGNGVSPRLLHALRRGRGDATVYIPMPGPHPSLNVATALACALYEYRAQWPQ